MTEDSNGSERIAKVMARSGVASRRDAERMILDGRVAINGSVITSPARDVTPADQVTLDGKPIDAPQPTRMWLYYKPLGLVTSEKDEKGRQTVFDTLPEGMPRVMSIGRLDLNSEGLLLLTNDGDLKRSLELPETGWLRKYRVRVNGHPNDQMLAPLREGMTIEGEHFLPMEISIDKQQGANAWLTIGLREGKNREIRRAMTEIGLIVNRLIRISYGPFRLNLMQPGDVTEVRARVMREQLGSLLGTEPAKERPRFTGSRSGTGSVTAAGAGAGAGRPTRSASPERAQAAEASSERKPRHKSAAQDGASKQPYRPRTTTTDGVAAKRPQRPAADLAKTGRRPEAAQDRPEGRKAYGPRTESGNKPGSKPGERKPRTPGGPPEARRPFGEKPRFAQGDGPRKARPPRVEGGPDRGRPDQPRRAGAETERKVYKPRPAGIAEDSGKPARPFRREGGDGTSDRAPRAPTAKPAAKPAAKPTGEFRARRPFGDGPKDGDKGPSGPRKPYGPKGGEPARKPFGQTQRRSDSPGAPRPDRGPRPAGKPGPKKPRPTRG